MKINNLIRYDDAGLPPNEFDGNYNPIPCRNKNQPQNPADTDFFNPEGIWGGLADEFIHRRIYTELFC